MEAICIKIEDDFARDIEKAIKEHHYTTKTEFVREAMRDKLSDLEKEELLKQAVYLRGASKHKTTDEEVHQARKKLSKIWETRFK